MLHQILFLVFYLGLLPAALLSPFAGVLMYYWLEYLPPEQVYSAELLSGSLSFLTAALTFAAWLLREKKTLPRPLLLALLMVALLVWINITSFNALVPTEVGFEWSRTVKVIGFAILTAQMLSTRARLEAFVWVFVLGVSYFAIPSAVKVLVSGGSGGIGAGEVVVAASGSFFGDRVTLSVVLAMALPLTVYVRRHATLMPVRWMRRLKPALLVLALCFLIASIGTFARTAVFASGAALAMLAIRSNRKLLTMLVIGTSAVMVVALAPEGWLQRMDTITQYQNDSSAMSRLEVWGWAWQFTLQHPLLGGGFGVFRLDAGSITGQRGWLEAHNIFFQMMAEHGFVGLGLFCWLIVAVYRSCAVVQKRARSRKELAWAMDLARAIQISLAAYVAGGMFVSIATTSSLYLLAAITVGTRSLVERQHRAVALPSAVLTQPVECTPF